MSSLTICIMVCITRRAFSASLSCSIFTRTLGTTTSDASGHFVFQQDQPGGGPQLLQANYAGVNYNKLMTPNIPTSGVELDVYETTKSPAVAQVASMLRSPLSMRSAVVLQAIFSPPLCKRQKQ